MSDYSIISIDSKNVDELGLFWIKNKKHPCHIAKRTWLQERFDEGMRIKLILAKEGKHAGFLEYIPGEYTWRAVHDQGYMVIHCIWVNSKKFPNKGMATLLLDDCLVDAKTCGKKIVAVVTSDGSFMAGKGVFIKNGYTQVDEASPHYQSLVKYTKPSIAPRFPKNWDERFTKLDNLQLLYTNQCPYIGKAFAVLPLVAEKFDARLQLIEMRESIEVRERAPSPFGVFNLVNQGRLLADHPISATRVRNILLKELKLVEKN